MIYPPYIQSKLIQYLTDKNVIHRAVDIYVPLANGMLLFSQYLLLISQNKYSHQSPIYAGS